MVPIVNNLNDRLRRVLIKMKRTMPLMHDGWVVSLREASIEYSLTLQVSRFFLFFSFFFFFLFSFSLFSFKKKKFFNFVSALEDRRLKRKYIPTYLPRDGGVVYSTRLWCSQVPSSILE